MTKLTVDKDRVDAVAARRRARKKCLNAKPHPLASICHPHWCALEDHTILAMKADGVNFTEMGGRIKRTRIEVEQRWHRLRVVKDISEKLEAFGLSKEPYEVLF